MNYLNAQITQNVLNIFFYGFTLRKEPVPNDLEVINCSSGDIYEISMKAAIGVFCNATLKNPMENKIWDYGGKKLTACYYDFLLQVW